MLLETLYAGSKGTHLFRYRNWNNAYHVETGENLDPRPGTLQELRTFPTLGPILENETSSNSIYHSLQLRFEKRFSANLSSINSFTWAKSIDDGDVPVKDFYQSPGAQDERNLRLERGLSAFDIRKRFTSALVYQLPFGKGQRFLQQGWLSYVVGPWQVSSILTFQDGYPQDLRGFVTLSTIGGVLQRPNVVPGQRIVLSDEERRRIQPTPAVPHPEFLYYNPGAVSQPGPFELGNAGRNIGPTPGFANLDLAVFRTIPIGEGRQLQLRADFINALNVVNLGIPIPSYEFVGFYGRWSAGRMRSIRYPQVSVLSFFASFLGARTSVRSPAVRSQPQVIACSVRAGRPPGSFHILFAGAQPRCRAGSSVPGCEPWADQLWPSAEVRAGRPRSRSLPRQSSKAPSSRLLILRYRRF
jgi:hypothetical protein